MDKVKTPQTSSSRILKQYALALLCLVLGLVRTRVVRLVISCRSRIPVMVVFVVLVLLVVAAAPVVVILLEAGHVAFGPGATVVAAYLRSHSQIQRPQYPSIKDYTLTGIRVPLII